MFLEFFRDKRITQSVKSTLLHSSPDTSLLRQAEILYTLAICTKQIGTHPEPDMHLVSRRRQSHEA